MTVAAVVTMLAPLLVVPGAALADQDTTAQDATAHDTTAQDASDRAGLDGIDHADRGLVPGAIPGDPASDPALGADAFTTAEVADDELPVIVDEVPDDDPAFTTASNGFPIRASVAGTGDIAPPIQIRGGGWGHGVGMSQYGAFAQALSGRNATQILTSYYPNTQVTTDTRSSEQRIRAGIAINQDSTRLRPLDGTMTMSICSPNVDQARNGRIPHRGCQEWFTATQNTQLRVRPLPRSGQATPAGTQSTVNGELVTIDANRQRIGPASGPSNGATTGTTSPIPAPQGGLLVERQSGESWVPIRAYATPFNGPLPVLRANHGSGRIEAQSYASPERRYRFGWRDIHLTGELSSGTQRLAIVQDVASVEQYLRGLAEVPNSWASATLQAQAITGRTYALRGSRGGGCFCDKLSTAADQVFIGESKVEAADGQRWAEAVEATRDRVLTFQGALAQTFYSSSHGGRTENIEDSWAYGTEAVPYLRSADDPWSLDARVNNPRANWTNQATNADMAAFLSSGQSRAINRVERIVVRSRTDGGTPRVVRVTGRTSGGERITFDTDLRSRYAKGIAGAAMRRELRVTGGANDRLFSSQIRGFGFGPFTDDDATTHEYAITWAAQAGVVQGVTPTTFEPGSPVTRAQMATFLNNTFQLPTPGANAPSFPDVTPGATHSDAIIAIAAAGITVGREDGTYGPADPVTRQEMASFLARAMALSTQTRGTFTDVRNQNVHANAIESIAERGITTGCDADRFCPGETVSRQQLASFVYRVVRG